MGCFCPGHNRLMNKMEKKAKPRSFQPWGPEKFRRQELTQQNFLGFLIPSLTGKKNGILIGDVPTWAPKTSSTGREP